jgi:hypothetical protein
MKTTLEEMLAAAAANMKLTSRKAFKHPITSILSLCLVAGIAATLASFSQTSEPAVAITPTTQTMPVARTLTSSDGRAIDVTILSKSDTAIKAKKADGKEVEITLDKLSDTDKTFVAGLVEAPVKKMTALILGELERLTTRMGKAGFDITVVKEGANNLKTMSDQELEYFDAIILGYDYPRNTSDPIQLDRLLKLTHDEKIIAWRHYYKTDKREFIKKKMAPCLFKGSGEMRDQEPFINIQGNAIFYSWTKSNDKTGGEIADVSIFDQVVVELKRLIQQKALVQKQPK